MDNVRRMPYSARMTPALPRLRRGVGVGAARDEGLLPRVTATLLYVLYYHLGRRLFRVLARGLLSTRSRIIAGPLRGRRFVGGELAYLLGIYELPVQRALMKLLAPGDVVYDLGANFGYLSLVAADRVGPEGRVYAFEPLPSNQEVIHHLMAANGVEHYVLVKEGVARAPGHRDLVLPDDGNHTTPTLASRHGARVPITVTSLDAFASSHRHPRVVKVDVEGAEAEVLEGARHLFAAQEVPVWIIELHGTEAARGVREMLQARGYTIQTLTRSVTGTSYPCHVLAMKTGRRRASRRVCDVDAPASR